MLIWINVATNRTPIVAAGWGVWRAQMRPNSIWSDYEARAQRQWMSTSKRGARSSIGPKILLAAAMVVAGVIGISGIYPQFIDAEWMQDSGTHLPTMLSPTTSATTKPSTTATALPLRARDVVSTGQTAVSSPRTVLPPLRFW